MVRPGARACVARRLFGARRGHPDERREQVGRAQRRSAADEHALPRKPFTTRPRGRSHRWLNRHRRRRSGGRWRGHGPAVGRRVVCGCGCGCGRGRGCGCGRGCGSGRGGSSGRGCGSRRRCGLCGNRSRSRSRCGHGGWRGRGFGRTRPCRGGESERGHHRGDRKLGTKVVCGHEAPARVGRSPPAFGRIARDRISLGRQRARSSRPASVE
jgi:hypothetical protein